MASHNIQKSMHSADPIVESTASSPRQHSTFNLSHDHVSSSRFGEVTPRLAIDIVPVDRAEASCRSGISTYTLSNEFRGDVNLHRDNFFIPYRAIYNRSYDVVVPLNTRGSEPSFANGENPLCSMDFRVLVDAMYRLTIGTPTAPLQRLAFCLHVLLSTTWLYSPDSLPTTLRMANYTGALLDALRHFNNGLPGTPNEWPEVFKKVSTITDLLDLMYSSLPETKIRFYIDNDLEDATVAKTSIDIVFSQDKSHSPISARSEADVDGTVHACWRDFPQIYHAFGGMVEVRGAAYENIGPIFVTFMSVRQAVAFSVFGTTSLDGAASSIPDQSVPISPDYAFNYTRLIAYQMACAQFYTEQDIDDIYSARRWYEYFDSLYNNAIDTSTNSPIVSARSQVIDGVFYSMEPYAGGPLWWLFHSFRNRNNPTTWADPFSTNNLIPSLVYDLHIFDLLFGKNMSLQHRDYFVGARPQPLATGSDDLSVFVPVNTVESPATVSVVDISRAMGVQRLRNFANSVGRKARQYVSKLFHVDAAPDSLSVVFLSSTRMRLHPVDVENTGDAQYNAPVAVTSALRGADSSYQFSYSFSDYGVLLSLIRYSARTLYVGTSDRTSLICNKYELYNPFLQFQGDQAIRLQELFGIFDSNPYGYTTRDMQYKTLVDVATGAYDDVLVPFNIVRRMTLSFWNFRFTNMVNIRNFDFMFNLYYQILTGDSPASYFHFLDESSWDIKISRDMAAMPKLLA